MKSIVVFSDSGGLPESLRQLMVRLETPVCFMPRNCWDAKRGKFEVFSDSAQQGERWLALVDLDLEYSQSESRFLKEVSRRGGVTFCFSSLETTVQFNKLAAYNSHGFINRHASEKAWQFALNNVTSWGGYWPEYLSKELSLVINKVHRLKPNKGVQLSARQKQVLYAIKKGKTNQQISQQLDVTLYTTKSHIAALFKKLDVHNRMQCLSKAEQYNLF